MTERFTETTDWRGASWAFAVWAAHFSVLWGASSMFPGIANARWIALFATLAALAKLYCCSQSGFLRSRSCLAQCRP